MWLSCKYIMHKPSGSIVHFLQINRRISVNLLIMQYHSNTLTIPSAGMINTKRDRQTTVHHRRSQNSGDSNSVVLPWLQVSPVDKYKQDEWLQQAIWWTQWLTTSHFLEINLPHREQLYMDQTIRPRQETTWILIELTFEPYILTLLSHNVAWQIRGQNELVDHLLNHTLSTALQCKCEVSVLYVITFFSCHFNPPLGDNSAKK